MNSGNVKFRQGLAKMADEALGAIDLEKVEAALVVTIMTATDRNQTEPVANWLSDVRSLADRVGGELEKKLAWLGSNRNVVTAENKPVARTGQARPIDQRNQREVAPTISRLVQMGQQDKSSAPGDPMAEFREVLESPEPTDKDARPKYWRKVRGVVCKRLLSGMPLRAEDWERLVEKMQVNLYTLAYEADNAFFTGVSQKLLTRLLLGEDETGQNAGVIAQLRRDFENNPSWKDGKLLRAAYFVAKGLQVCQFRNNAHVKWAEYLVAYVQKLDGPQRLIEALGDVQPFKEEVASKAQKSAAEERRPQPRQSARRQPLPNRKFHPVHGDPDLEVDPKDLQKVQAAAKVPNNPFAVALEGVRVNGNGKEAVVAQ